MSNYTPANSCLPRLPYRFNRPAGLLALLLVLVLALHAVQASAKPLPGLRRGAPRQGLASVLTPDGLIRPGSTGSFNPEGFRLETGPDGRPAFRPVGSAGAGDAQWRAAGNGTNGTVFAVAITGTDVYVGGVFTLAGGVTARGVARWNGSAWSALGPGLGSATVPGIAYALAITAAGEVYVGGDFSEIGGSPVASIAKWNGTAWSTLGSGVSGGVRALALAANGDLYVGGGFTRAGGISSESVAKWNGTAWSALGRGLSGGTSIGGTVVRALAIAPNGDVFAGGDFTEATSGPGLNYLARWDGAAWNPLGSGTNGPVRGLALSSPYLYACGDFTTASAITTGRLARWNGSAWSTVGGVYSSTLITNCVAVASNGDLFVGGGTIYLGNATTPGIAKWNGVSWSTLGTGLNDLVRTIVVGANRQVNTGGSFTAVGDNSKPIPYFGIYDDSQAIIATITSFTPTSGPVGTTVTINGTNLTGASSITFAGPGDPTVSSGFAVNAAGTQITGVVVPAGAQTGRIRVTTPIGVATSPASFTVPVPILTGISPASGAVGTSVTISGTNLAGATQVSFNGTTTSAFTSSSATQIVLLVPAGATSGPVTVVTPLGTSNALTFTVTCPVATVAYSAPSYCQTSPTNPSPTLTGPTGGSFTAAAGLTLNTMTGVITPATSTPGTYTVTYAAGTAACPTSATTQVAITAAPSAVFSYGTSVYCSRSGDQAVPILGSNAVAGTFSASSPGLTLNATNGVIFLATSLPGTYTVTNTVGASGGCAAVSATATIIVNPMATATLSAGGPTTFCQGGSVVITASGDPGNTYQFLRNYAAISGATTATYTATTSGDYSVIVTSASGCAALSSSITVTVDPTTSAAFSYSGGTYCISGPNPTPTVTGTAGGTFTSAAGLNLNASTGQITLASSTPGTYAVLYSVGGPCPSSATASVTIAAAPTAAFSYAAATGCAGSTGTAAPTLSTGSTAGTFSSAAGLTISATTGVITLGSSTAGTYTVTNTVAAAGGCAAVTATVAFTVNPRPATPVLTATYNGTATTLTSSAATGNQFYLGGTAITGATNQTYVVNGTPAQLGSYTVATTNAAGCVSLPSTPLVVTASAKPLTGTSLAIYPNPTPDGRLTVELTGYRHTAELAVLNALGQVVFAAKVPGSIQQTGQTVDLTRLPAGIYILRVKTDGGLDARRIVRE